MSFRKEGCKGGAAMVTMLMIFLIILATTIEASEDATTIEASEGYISKRCNLASNYTQGSPVEKNLQHVLGELPNETASSTKSYHTSLYGEIPSGVYAVAMCRGDITETQCRRCVGTATSWVHKLCQRGLGGTFWYNHCFLDWRNYTGSAADVDLGPLTAIKDERIASNITAFSQTVRDLLGKLIAKALQSTNTKRFASGKAALDSIHTVYGLVQCWGDISIEDCHACLANQYDNIGRNATKLGLLGAQSFTRNCLAQYDNSNFFAPAATPALPPTMVNFEEFNGPTLVSATSSGNTKPGNDEYHNNQHSTAAIIGETITGAGILLALILLGLLIHHKLLLILHKLKTSRKHDSNNHMHTTEASLGTLPIFTHAELSQATNSFNENNKLGEGGSATVFRGKLRDGRNVAVKKFSQGITYVLQDFMKEALAYKNLNHPRIVRLYGCSSRSMAPLMMVFELVDNGTLAHHLHGDGSHNLTWNIRLKIAIQLAETLAFLHNSCPQMLHRDVKSSNILLDENLDAKVADFGISRLMPTDATHATTRPCGTPGYIDPEYFRSSQLTEKSDVYSYGVVLMEIVSSKKAVDFSRQSDNRNLAVIAKSKMAESSLHELIDENILREAENDTNVKDMVYGVAELACKCLASKKNERPTMREVVSALMEISMMRQKVPSRSLMEEAG